MIYANKFIVRKIPQRYKIVKVGNGGLTLTGTQFEELQETVGEPNARRILRKYENGNNSDDLYIVYIKEDDKIEIVDEIYGFEALINKYKGIVRFTKAERSSFRYWFAHWCAFQLTALNLKIWKFKYLFHDCEKPWLKLIWPYKKVQSFHRFHNKHHLEYGLEHGFDKVDWEALMIDWECSEYTKEKCPLDCRGEMENKISQNAWKDYGTEIRSHLEPLLDKYKI